MLFRSTVNAVAGAAMGTHPGLQGLNPNQLAKIQQSFRMFDVSGDGMLDRQEALAAFFTLLSDLEPKNLSLRIT